MMQIIWFSLVRLCADKLEIIDQCLKEKKNGYKKKDKVLPFSYELILTCMNFNMLEF